jgi:O-antigen ligase
LRATGAAPSSRFVERLLAVKIPEVFAMGAFGYTLVGGFTLLIHSPNLQILIVVALLGITVATSTAGMLRSLRLSLPSLLWATVVLLSVLWATEIGTWLGQVKIELLPILTLSVVAAIVPVPTILRVWRLICYGVVVQSLLATAANPGETTQRPGDLNGAGWHGNFEHKNNFSMFMVLTAILVIATEPRRGLRNFMLVLLTVLVALSRSATGMSCLFAVYIVWGILAYREAHPDRAQRAFAWSAVLSLVLVASAAVTLFPWVVQLYGKDATLSGRTDIWSASWRAITERPLTGYAPGGLWQEPAREPTRSILSDIGFSVFHSHNGAIEILLRYGIFGLAAFLLLLVVVVRSGIVLVDHEGGLGWVLLMFATLLVVGSIGETPVIGFWPATLVALHIMAVRELSARPRRGLRTRSLGSWRRTRARLAGSPG